MPNSKENFQIDAEKFTFPPFHYLWTDGQFKLLSSFDTKRKQQTIDCLYNF